MKQKIFFFFVFLFFFLLGMWFFRDSLWEKNQTFEITDPTLLESVSPILSNHSAQMTENDFTHQSTEMLVESLEKEIFIPLATSSTDGILRAMKNNPLVSELLQRAQDDATVLELLRKKAESFEEPKQELWQGFIKHFEEALK